MKPLSLYMVKLGSKLEFRPHQKTLYNVFVGQLQEGDTVHMRMEKNRPRKTNPQLSYWYGIVLPYTVEGMRNAGHSTVCEASIFGFNVPIATDRDSVDWMYKSMFQAHKMLDRKVEKTKMSVDEMSELIDFALTWAGENLGIYIPTPEANQCGA